MKLLYKMEFKELNILLTKPKQRNSEQKIESISRLIENRNIVLRRRFNNMDILKYKIIEDEIKVQKS